MFIAPMLLDQQEKPFSDKAYVFEPKIDGHRLIISKVGKETRLFTRHHNECTRQYPELWQVPVDGEAVLDGEVCSADAETGNIDFELLMDRFQLKKADKIRTLSKQRPVHCIVWDILFYNGRDLRTLPLMKRRSILEAALKPNEFFSIVPQIEGRGEDLYKTIVERKMEGMVAKKKDSKYVSRRSHDWMKIINYQYETVCVSGYRKDEYGWLAHIEENGEKRPAGTIKFGGNTKQRQSLYTISKKLIIGEDKNFVYLDPQIKAKVKFRNWTRHGMLRDPALVDFVV
jgi:DNA ligase-1